MREIYEKNREGILYLLFGGMAFGINVVVFMALDIKAGLNELIANVIAWVLCVVFQFFTNKLIVFRKKDKDVGALVKSAVMFVLSCLFTLGLEELIIWIFITNLAYNSFIVKIAAQAVVIITNYILRKWIVFRK